MSDPLRDLPRQATPAQRLGFAAPEPQPAPPAPAEPPPPQPLPPAPGKIPAGPRGTQPEADLFRATLRRRSY
jgi:hypothetical protein